ncbi:hypothetical protein GH714_025461 [Hevea brasiliensis]|uniref:Uncharacterized protein n=1 Tax=Hevea brasiliensis TaxID=3981 RepID=A0A6A6MWY1_HEVBR|nr:hypothetical protein GH714_025461 [Hevea brasiliensis]
MEICTYIGADLLEAAENGKLDPFKNYGAPLDSLLSPNKNTILHIYLSTLGERSTEFIEEILEIFPPLLLKVNVHGDTPLHIAAREENKLLEKYRSMAKEKDQKKRTEYYSGYTVYMMIDQLLEKWSNLAKETDEKGWTPLHYAVYTRNWLAVHVLLNKDKSTAYIADKYWKRTALHIAACRGFQYEMDLIISECPDCCELTDSRGWNVIHYAVISKNDEVLKAVLQYSSLIYLLYGEDVKGNTPVHLYKTYHSRLPSFIKMHMKTMICSNIGEHCTIKFKWKETLSSWLTGGILFIALRLELRDKFEKFRKWRKEKVD